MAGVEGQKITQDPHSQPGVLIQGCGGAHLCIDSSCPCCSRTTAAVVTWGLPTTAFKASTKPSLSSPCRGETHWQGHSKIPGATWPVGGVVVGVPLPVNRGTHTPTPLRPGARRALGALLGISSHFTDEEKRPASPGQGLA